MSSNKEFILFIPGMGARAPKQYLEKLLAGIENYCDAHGMKFKRQEETPGADNGRCQIEISTANKNNKLIEIQEVYWGDLCPPLSTEPILRKALHGLLLLAYWTMSARLWMQATHSKYMIFNMLFTLLILLSWYYGALATVFTAIGANPDSFGFQLPESMANFFKNIGENMGGWYVWGISSLVMAILPVTAVVDISYAVKLYLQNRNGLLYKVCGRVKRALAVVDQPKENYDRVTVLSHSFGVVVSTEVLAEYRKKSNSKLRTITLGGPLLLIAARSSRVKEALEKVLENEDIETWVDFFSNQDWLCTLSLARQDTEKYESVQITSSVSVEEKLNGASHHLYFTDWAVMKAILH